MVKTDTTYWVSWKHEKPIANTEVLAFSSFWVDEDYNPDGIRIGFRQDFVNSEETIEAGFHSAVWNNYNDHYDTDFENIPEKWVYIHELKR